MQSNTLNKQNVQELCNVYLLVHKSKLYSTFQQFFGDFLLLFHVATNLCWRSNFCYGALIIYSLSAQIQLQFWLYIIAGVCFQCLYYSIQVWFKSHFSKMSYALIEYWCSREMLQILPYLIYKKTLNFTLWIPWSLST